MYHKSVSLVNMEMNIRLNNRANRVIASFLGNAVPHGVNCIEVSPHTKFMVQDNQPQ
jgi:hypothetical protein